MPRLIGQELIHSTLTTIACMQHMDTPYLKYNIILTDMKQLTCIAPAAKVKHIPNGGKWKKEAMHAQ